MNACPNRDPSNPPVRSANKCDLNLGDTRLTLYISSTPDADVPVTEVGGIFSGYSHSGFCDTPIATVSIPPDSISGQVIHDFTARDPRKETCDMFEDTHPLVGQMANNFRERVENCSGPDRTGQCGALGESAVQGVLRATLHVDEFLALEDEN